MADGPGRAAEEGPRSIEVDFAQPGANVWHGRFQSFQDIAVLDNAAQSACLSTVRGLHRKLDLIDQAPRTHRADELSDEVRARVAVSAARTQRPAGVVRAVIGAARRSPS